MLIVGGSGPIDRDGRSPPSSWAPYAALAAGLAAHGIASVRYDKRGSSLAPRFADRVDQAAAWARTLRADPRVGTLVVAGHSEGSLVGMLAAASSEDAVDGFVSLAGPATRAGELIVRQAAQVVPAATCARIELAVRAIGRGETVEVAADLRFIFDAALQPYLRAWFGYDPPTEMARLRVPCLVVHGGHDTRVPPSDAYQLGAAANAEVCVVAEMGHMLDASGGPAPCLAAGLIAPLVAFVRSCGS